MERNDFSAMSSANFIIAENSTTVVKQEVMEEAENRGVKRSYVQFEPSGTATKVAKKEEVDCHEIEIPTAGASPVSPHMVEYEVYSPQPDPSTSYMLVPEVKREESELIEAIPVVKRGRGRPPGVKNRPKSERPLKIRKRFNNAKTAFTYAHMISLALMNSPEEKAMVPMLYEFIEYNFPGVPTSNECWKNTLRHALMPKNGFQKQEDNSGTGITRGSRDNFWTIIPERREELINSILEKIEEHKENMEILRMRNIDDLPAMLKGECPLPEEARVYAQPAQSRQRTSPETVETVEFRVKQENQEEEFYPEYAPQDYWIPYPMPPGAVPYYSHPYAYHPASYYGYPVPQNGYGMPIYGYSNEEISNGSSPSVSATIFQQQFNVINDEKPPVFSLSNGIRSPQYPIRIVKQVSTSPAIKPEIKVEEPST